MAGVVYKVRAPRRWHPPVKVRHLGCEPWTNVTATREVTRARGPICQEPACDAFAVKTEDQGLGVHRVSVEQVLEGLTSASTSPVCDEVGVAGFESSAGVADCDIGNGKFGHEHRAL